VTASVAAETEGLHRLIHQAAQIAGGAPFACVDGAMLISRPSGRRPYVVLASPLRAGQRRVDDRQPAVVVFASDPERTPEFPPARLSRLYGLTPAEAQLALQVAGGHDLREIAATSKRTMNTVRTQLKQVFHKTGVKRQAQLMRLVLQIEGMNMPGGRNHLSQGSGVLPTDPRPLTANANGS
jgi:DNA-binding CsgD family transcriptional regulator